MADNTKIEWCDATFNPWVGCTKVSAACDHCYAEGWAKRTGHPELWAGERRRTTASYWQRPLKWERQAEAAGIRKRVFCASLADVFDNQVPTRWRDDLWFLIDRTPSLDWLLLTKRPQNIWKMLPDSRTGIKPWGGQGWRNVWLGATAENQEEADRRIPYLMSVPAAVSFLSCEPLLGPINLRGNIDREIYPHAISWTIIGGESGPGARPMHPAWARSLRDQCQASDCAYFFKQWGAWTPGENVERSRGVVETATLWQVSALDRSAPDVWDFSREDLAQEGGHRDDEPDLYRVGKRAAGRLLDGREWSEFPAP